MSGEFGARVAETLVTRSGRAAASVCAGIVLAVGTASAQPAAATVLIRVSGEVTVALGADDRVWRPSVELRDRQIATGSGFLISPSGYILTNSHLLHPEEMRVLVEGRQVFITLAVQRISVVLQEAGRSAGALTFDAYVVADDPAVDLAVLHVQGHDLPHLTLGDSRRLSQQDTVTAWGFPFGEALEIETDAGRRLPPVTASTGTVAALRDSGAAGLPGDVPYVQFTAPLNPGNSGGPLTDRDGYVVGLAQATLENAGGVSFAIAVEGIKRFLELHGLDSILPVTRLSPGSLFDFAGKGLRLQVPAGFTDSTLSPVAVRSGGSLGRVALLIDRIHTSWDVRATERALLEGESFGGPAGNAMPDHIGEWQERPRTRTGLARLETRPESQMLYAIVDLGAEKVVARYLAWADDLAYNFGTLRDSLATLEATPLVRAPLTRPLDPGLTTSAVLPPSASVRFVPAGFFVEYAVPGMGCPGAPAPVGGLTATFEDDFTVRLTAVWWKSAVSASQVGASCLGGSGSQRRWSRTSYGITEVIETVLVDAPNGPVLLQTAAPEGKAVLVEAAFAAWVRSVGNVSK